MLDWHLPDLSFPHVTFGPKETRWTLRPLLYMGGALAPAKNVAEMIDSGQLGRPLVDRIELVCLIHENLVNYSSSGGRRSTTAAVIENLRYFFRWADATNYPLSIATVEIGYRDWCDNLLHHVQVWRDIKEITAYGYASRVGWVLDKVLGRGNPLIKTTRLYRPKTSSRVISQKEEKQNLAETFSFGHFLLDLSSGLEVDAIWGPLPVQIPLRNGKTLEEWSGLKRLDTIKPPNTKYPNQAQ